MTIQKKLSFKLWELPKPCGFHANFLMKSTVMAGSTRICKIVGSKMLTQKHRGFEEYEKFSW